MSSEAFFAILAAAWILVPAAPVAIERLEEWHEARLAEIRAAEELADRQLKKAIASLRATAGLDREGSR